MYYNERIPSAQELDKQTVHYSRVDLYISEHTQLMYHTIHNNKNHRGFTKIGRGKRGQQWQFSRGPRRCCCFTESENMRVYCR